MERETFPQRRGRMAQCAGVGWSGKPAREGREVLTVLKYLVFSLVMATMAAAQKPEPALPKVYIDTTYQLPAGQSRPAHTAAELKDALAAAAPGDTIVLDAGVTYAGNFTLPAKRNPKEQWIYIISSNLSKLPAAGARVSPSDAVNMPKLVTVAGLGHHDCRGRRPLATGWIGSHQCLHQGLPGRHESANQLFQLLPDRSRVDALPAAQRHRDRPELHTRIRYPGRGTCRGSERNQFRRRR